MRRTNEVCIKDKKKRVIDDGHSNSIDYKYRHRYTINVTHSSCVYKTGVIEWA